MYIKKIINKFALLLKYFVRVTSLRIKLVPLDKKLPFKGKLYKSGY